MPVAEDGSTVNAGFYAAPPLSRGLAAAVRTWTDATNKRIASTKGSRQVLATIAAVTAGAASDGNALVLVLWRGSIVQVAGYAASYTPVANHRVVCDLIDNQLMIAYRVIGQP